MTFPRRLIALALVVLAMVVCSGGSKVAAMHHLHLYMHEKEGSQGPRPPSAVMIVNGTGAAMSPSGERFGDTRVMDDLLTEGPGLASRAVGRAQGMYVMASLQPGQPAMTLTVNVVLNDYNGSSLAVVGRNNVMAPVRELAVVGGTGRFRMATGYVLWKTFSWKDDTAVLELDIFVRTPDDA